MVANVSGNGLGLSTSSLATLGQRGVFGNAEQGRAGEQAYVNLATGNLVLQRRDGFVAGLGQGIDMLRTYNSNGMLDDDNGDNWSIGIYNQPLRLVGTLNTSGSMFTRTASDGALSKYAFDAALSLYVNTDGAGAYDTLRWDGTAGQYVWTDGDSGAMERYEGSGVNRLVARSDAQGNTTRYVYGTSGLLSSVVDASGETAYYDYVGNNLSQIRVVAQDGSTSTRVRYTYDTSNRLASVTVDLSPGDNSIADGKVYQTTYTYDGTSRRVASVAQSDGTRLDVSYVLVNGGYKVATVRDGLGMITRYAYDTVNRTTTVTDPLNVASRYGYDVKGQLLSVQTGITSARPTGLSQLNYSYDVQGNVTAMTDALGRSTNLQYDARGNQTLKTDPLGNTLVSTYDQRNRLLTETLRTSAGGDATDPTAPAPVGSTTRYIYSNQAHGQLRFSISAEGRVTEYRYNALGQRVTALAYAANTYDISNLSSSVVPTETQMAGWAAGQDLRGGQRIDTQYDFRGQVAYSTAYGTLNAAGVGTDPVVTQYVYSQAGELLKTVQPRTDSVTQYVYDGLGRVIVATAPSSDGTSANTVITEYGASTTKVTLVNGLSTLSSYDVAGRLISVQQSSAAMSLGITSYTYDAAGRVVMTQDPTGMRQWVVYDDVGRKVADVDGTGAAKEYRYNANGQLAQTIAYSRTLVGSNSLIVAPTLASLQALAGEGDRKSWRVYDSAQRLVAEIDATGAVTETEYDAASRVVAVTRLATRINTQILGDGSNFTAGISGLPLARVPEDRTVAQIYSRDGLLIGTGDGEGYLTEYRYDAAGRTIGSVRYERPVAGGAAAGLAAARTGASLNGLRPLSGPVDVHTAYFYDAQGRRTGELDAEGYLTRNSYDPNGNLVTTRRYITPVTSITAAQVTAATRLESILPGELTQDQVTTRTYDALNRVVLSLNAEGTYTSYRYDNVGRLVETVQAAGTAEARSNRVRYDLQGRVVGELTPQGATLLTVGLTEAQIEAVWQQYGVRHTYDASGRRTSTTDQNGQKTLFFYDPAANLTYTVNALGEVSESRYTAFGELMTSTVRANRINLSMLAVYGGASGGLVNANVRTVLNTAQNVAADRSTNFRYYATGKLSYVADALLNYTDYTYNTFGEEDRRTSGVRRGEQTATQVLATTYDRRGLAVKVTQDPNALNVFSTTIYDAFGRATTSVDALGRTRTQAFDRLGRLVLTTDALNASVRTCYDAFNRVVRQTNALLNDTTYVYNLQDRSVTVTTPEGISVTTVHDRLGQTLSVKDGSGAITRYEYDVNGRQTAVQTPLTRTASRYDISGRLVETTDANGVKTILAYDAANRVLTRTVDPVAGGLNLVTRYSYNALGNQITVTDARGVVTEFGYDLKGQLVRQAVDPAGLNLVTTFAYDSLGQNVTVTDPNGTATAYQYDALGRRVLEVVDPSTAVRAGLNLAKRYTYDAVGNATSVTDGQGHTTRYVYDKENRQRFVLDAAGNLAETVYDTAGRIVRQTRYANPIANVDGLAQPLTEVQLDSLKQPNVAQDLTEHRVYDKDNRLTATVNGAGDVVRLVYDANGRVVLRTAYATRLIIPGQWFPGQQPQPTPNSSDAVTSMVYDALGRVRYTIDGSGAVVSQRYDANGNVTQRIRYANRLNLVDQPLSAQPSESEMELRLVYIFNAQRDEHTLMRYDAAGRMTLSADGAGGVSQYLYDQNGQLLQSTRYATSAGTFQWRDEGTTGFVSTTAAAGRHAIGAFEANGQPGAILGYVDDAAGPGNTALYLARNADGSYFYTTDSVNFAAARTQPGWSVEGSGIVGYIRTAPAEGNTALYRLNLQGYNTNRYTTSKGEVESTLIVVPYASLSDAFVRKVYDAAGRMTSEVDANGAVTTYAYDAAGRLVKETRHATPATAYRNAYAGVNLLGEPTAVALAQDRTTRHILDRAGREVFQIGADGSVTERVFDGAGQVVQLRQAFTRLNDTQLAALDLQRQQQGVLASSTVNSLVPAKAEDRVSRNYYDAAGQLRFTRDALGQLQGYVYDGTGRLTERTVFIGQQGADHWLDEGITGYTKSAGGTGLKPLYRLVRTSGSTDHFYTTDVAERDQLLQNGWRSEGDVGYLRSAPGPGAVPLYRLRPPGSSSTNHYYTASEELRANAKNISGWIDEGIIGYIDVAPGTDNTALYQLNVNGAGEHFYGIGRAEIDLALMPVPTRSSKDRTDLLHYDAAGNLVDSKDAGLQTESYTYDGTGRKTAFTNKLQKTWTYVYDSAGQLVQETSPEVTLAGGTVRVVTRMAYDAMGHLTQRTEAVGLPEERTTRYEYDQLGRQNRTILPQVKVYWGESASTLLENGRTGDASRSEVLATDISSETWYDALGNAVSGRTAGSTGWSYKAYDRAGNVAYEVDALGNVTGYARNAWGEVDSLVRYDKKMSFPAGGFTMLREADVRLALQTCSADREILTNYDRMGRVLEVQEPSVFFVDSQTGEASSGRKTTRNTYSVFGDLVSVSGNFGSARWATTNYEYDRLGRRTLTTDALGYATTQAYDAAGNLVSRVEFAQPGIRVPNAPAGDRITDYAYDVLNRKTAETRRGVAFTATNPGAAGVGDVLSDSVGDLTTWYAYDALGNVTRTTDALGASTYNYYDALGRVRATITPTVNVGVVANGQGAAAVNPLTEFQRDAHGNAVFTTQYKNGATLAADGSSYTRTAPDQADRVTQTHFDALGHTTETIDALGKSYYYSYDAAGRLAKEWQNVTYRDDAGNPQKQSLWRAYAYDVLGRQTNAYAPLQKGANSTQLTLSDTQVTYNAFGEVTSKRVLDNGQALRGEEKYEYDNAGRVWRSNAGDGVWKVLAYDLQGQQTVQLVASGDIGLDGYGNTMQALSGQSSAPTQFRRTDMRYDQLGRLTQTLAPERASEQAMNITTRENIVIATITQSQVVGGVYSNTRTNQVDIGWRSLENLGSGDVRITINYKTPEYQSTNSDNPIPGSSSTKSVVVSAEEAAEGYSFKWNAAGGDDFAGYALGIKEISRIQVEKKDVFGNWTSVYNVASAPTQLNLNWSQGVSPGYVWNEAGEGRSPVYRYYNQYTDTHFFSTSLTERARLLNVANGWLDEGIAGYVSKEPQQGLMALHRWTKQGAPDISVYTSTNTVPAPSPAGAWDYKGIEGYVGASEPEAIGKGMTKLYYLKDNKSSLGNSLYTTSLTDRDQLLGVTNPNGTVHDAMGMAANMGLSIEVSYALDLVSKTVLKYRLYGSTGAWTQAREDIQQAFGSAHRFDVGALDLSSGSYEYTIVNTKGELTRDVGSGTFSVNVPTSPDSVPPLMGVTQGIANIDGSPYRVLQWPKPAAGWNTEVRYRAQGSSGAWISQTTGNGLYSYGDGRSSGIGIGMQAAPLNWGSGNFEYEITAVNGTTGAKKRSTGTVNIPARPEFSNVSTAPVNQNNNVTNLGVVGYMWNTPAPGRTPLYRFYLLYQNNDHHLTSADPNVIAEMNAMVSSGSVINEGIIGYVETSATANNRRLYQYKYGEKTVWRLTANPQDIGTYTVLNSAPPANFQWAPKWYQSAYQFDGYISSVPVAGTVPLYAVYDGNSFGSQGMGDYLTATSEGEAIAAHLLNTTMAATANVPGVGTSQANIDGQIYNVLHWAAPEVGARVRVSGLPSTPTLWRQGDGRSSFQGGQALQGIVTDGMTPGVIYTVTIEIEYPAVGARSAYIARSQVTIKVVDPNASSAVVQRDTTPVYTPQTRVQAATPINLTNRAVVNRQYDRWGNVLRLEEPYGMGAGSQVGTTFRYNANNQVIEQNRPYENGAFAQSWATTRVYYDAMGRQVGVRDAEDHWNLQVRDLAGNVVQERKADGGRIDYGFNAFGEKVSSAEKVTASRTVVTQFTYDKLSRLTQTSLAAGISRYVISRMDDSVQIQRTGASMHSDNGVTLARVDQNVLESIEYDEAGRKVRVVNGNEEGTRYRYDRAGNVVLSGQETSLGSSILAYKMQYSYDALGRKIGQSDAAGMTQAWTYDIFGQMVGRTDSKLGGGDINYNLGYNLAGQLIHEGNNAGKNLNYRYDGAGQLAEILDNYLGQTTKYAYDLAGNRVSERMTQKTLLASGVVENVVYQDNHLVYDQQRRLRAVFDGRSDVRIAYDKVGNRTQVKTHVINSVYDAATNSYQDYVNTSTADYSFDAMNRQTMSREAPSIGFATTHVYEYDLAGNRRQDQTTYSGGDPTLRPPSTTYVYEYDDLHRIENYRGHGANDRMEIFYDGAGRQVYSKSQVDKPPNTRDEHRYNMYDATGKLQDTRVVLRVAQEGRYEVTQRTDVAYHDSNGATGLGYDAAGNLKGYRQVTITGGNQGEALTTRYGYQYLGGYQQTSSTATRGGTSATTTTSRDANGFISSITQDNIDTRFNRTFVNDAQGNAVYLNQGAGEPDKPGGRIQNLPGGYRGGAIGDATNPGHIQRQLVANGEVMARYGDAPDKEKLPDSSSEMPTYRNTAEFKLGAAPIRPKGTNLDAVTYTIVGGETLKDIARNLLGDASLWWRIADANGLSVSGDGQLTPGQSLSVPKLALNANNVGTFQPYDPSQITGSTDPLLPAPAGNGGGGCGGLGQIIMVVVAVVATIYTAGALAASGALGSNALGAATLAGTTTGGGLGATMAAGASVLGGGAGIGAGIAAGALGGAMGSIASQAAGNLIGAQDGFNWKNVALSALGGGVSAGLGGGVIPSTQNAIIDAAIRGAAGNAFSQGIGVVTGLQSSFSWRTVAASAAGAGVGAAVSEGLGLTDAYGNATNKYSGFDQFGRSALTGFAAGTAAAVMRGGKIAVQQIATDAFGNALGQSLAAGSGQAAGSSSSTGEDRLGAFIEQNQGAWNQRQASYDQMVDAFGNPTIYSRDNDVLLAAGSGYSGMGTSSQRDENIARMLRQANQPEAMGSEVRFRVEVNGFGWTGSNVLPDGTPVYRSTDPTNDLRMIEAANSTGTAPLLSGYGLAGMHTYAGGADLLYSPGAAQDATNVYSDSASANNPYSFNWNWIGGVGLGVGVPNLHQATPVPTNPIWPKNNGRWTGVPGNSGWVSTNASVNAVTGGRPVQFKNGMVNFDPWSQGRINVPDMTGRVRGKGNDLEMGRSVLREQYGLTSNAAAQRWLTERGLTLHHNANGLSLDLIPSDLHNTTNGGIRHTGGASILRGWDVPSTPLQYYRANQLATGARYLGAAGMAYGAYADGSSLYNQYQISQQTGRYGNTAAEATRIAGGWAGAWAVGTAGAEFGAGFGSVFGPVGTVAGGVVGGAVGGAFGYWGGSYAATHVSYDIGRWLSK